MIRGPFPKSDGVVQCSSDRDCRQRAARRRRMATPATAIGRGTAGRAARSTATRRSRRRRPSRPMSWIRAACTRGRRSAAVAVTNCGSGLDGTSSRRISASTRSSVIGKFRLDMSVGACRARWRSDCAAAALLPIRRAASATGRSSSTTKTRTARWAPPAVSARHPRSLCGPRAARGGVVGHSDLPNLEAHPATLLSLDQPKVVRELVACDPAQPGHRVRAAVVSRPSIDGGDEGLLGQLLGERRVVPAAGREIRIDARERPPVPGLERTVGRERDLQLIDAIGDRRPRSSSSLSPLHD